MKGLKNMLDMKKLRALIKSATKEKIDIGSKKYIEMMDSTDGLGTYKRTVLDKMKKQEKSQKKN